MQQLIQQLRDGQLSIQEVPTPALQRGSLLVRNHFSLISAGTEGATVRSARKSLLGKALERPQQTKQVLESLKRQGPVQTYRNVMKKLDAYSPLGYSCAGEVVGVADDVSGFREGDFVACGGVGFANHAEVVCVPQLLTVRLPEEARLDVACYNTLGAIALQGIRQADLRLGESCLVIGLGVLGQLTCAMLRASGVKTLGLDLNPHVVDVARRNSCDAAWTRSDPALDSEIARLTEGLGVDAVIITAASSSLDPINFAGSAARKRGRIVVVGNVPTGFDREPHFYRKELELRMSCSYGPGRYDPQYELHGRDYPAPYVRWTQNRNMAAFQQLLATGRINLDFLTTHRFPLDNAPRAYDMIVHGDEPHLGIVLQYDVHRPLQREARLSEPPPPSENIGLAFIGAGSYAQANLLPNLPNDSRVVRRCVVTNTGTTCKRVAERFKFQSCGSDAAAALADDRINTVFIATRHDTHAGLALDALRAGKHVFVEKPLCLTEDDLQELAAEVDQRPAQHVMVGFNRRFAPLAMELKSQLSKGPMAMVYRVNAGQIPSDSWIQDREIGGGRIVGEACHFVDFLTFLCGSLPVDVHATAVPDPDGFCDTINLSLQFANGSIGVVSYFANGAKNMPKEYVEVHQSGKSSVLNDYVELIVYTGSGKQRHRRRSQDKGQPEMMQQFVKRLLAGGPPLIPFAEIARVHQIVFAVEESLISRQSLGV